jgi:diaminohydroxyphosphoribosylaminopyrimidine deaminase / 5-amino-6-(5-phosphoribosylamino)uracil reductase
MNETIDWQFMMRCLELARNGYGSVNPNPMVGAVIVKNHEIIAEGYHRTYGGDHAEIDALKRAGSRAKGATLYVNLEPCNHFGKTPPCTTAIVKSGIRRVVYAADDPNPHVTGNGKKVLEENGIEVRSDIAHDEAVMLNEHFYFSARAKLPFVILKTAATLDGYIADVRSKSKWITGEAAREHVQNIRRGVDAVLVGAHTVMDDNPHLTVHDRGEPQPYRIILDGTLLTSVGARIYTDEFRHRTIVFCAASQKNKKKIEQLEKQGVTVIPCTSTGKMIPLRNVLRTLLRREIIAILVEGGSIVLRQFVESKLFAKAVFFIAPKLLGGGVQVLKELDRPLRSAYTLHNVTSEMVGDDIMIRGYSSLYKKYI